MSDRTARAEGEHEEPRARRMWRALEPVHAVVYFAPEPQQRCEELGLRGYWHSYFALRSAPLGAVSAPVVTALFYTFHPGLVARSIPTVWRFAAPEQYVDLRLEVVDTILRRLLGTDVVTSPQLAEAAELARAAAEAAPTGGRALAAAVAALPWPTEPHLALWHAQTVLREYRGDGHVSALVTAGLDPVEALVAFAADTGLNADRLRSRRGWSEQEWDAARQRLRDRGLVDSRGRLTPAGRTLRREIEALTDRLADAPWQELGDTRAERLVELVNPLVERIVAGGGFLPGNPMGLRPLVTA